VYSCWCEIIIFIISGFGIYGAAVVPDSGVGNTWQRLTLVLHEFLSNGLTSSRLHIVISFLTHADHVFLGLPRFLVPGTPNRVMELMQEVARCTCPYHLRRRVRRTAVISSTSNFWWSTAEEISSYERQCKKADSERNGENVHSKCMITEHSKSRQLRVCCSLVQTVNRIVLPPGEQIRKSTAWSTRSEVCCA